MKLLLIPAIVAALAVQPAPAADSKVDFAKDIAPLLEKHCVRCHGAEKSKGGLRLDTKEAAMKGGKNGKAILPRDAAKSEFHKRVILPKSDEDRMPNEGEPLTKAQTDLIKSWINQGADWPAGMAIKSGGGTGTVAGGPQLPANFKVSAAETKAVATLTAKGFEVRPIAMNVPWTMLNLRLHGTNVNDATLAPLKDVMSLTDLNLAGTKITDAGLASIAGLTNLTRLHLEQTAVTDAGLKHLRRMRNLTYLNLFGTQVGDAGLNELKDMKFLKSLYVWQSKVTTNGVNSVKALLPKVEVSMGWSLADLPKPPEPEKKDEKKK
jgi:mono/diheme cytochrome c family protein